MNIDERLEFMARNIESLHEAVFANTSQIAEIKNVLSEINRALAIDAENIRRLARVAEAHEARLGSVEDKLDGGVQ